MATNDKKPDNAKKRTRPDPVSLYPLDFEEALKGLLAVPPPPKEPKPKKDDGKNGE